MKFWLKKVVALSAFMPLTAPAQSGAVASSSAPVEKITHSRRHHLFGQLRAESMQYMTTVDSAPELNQSQFLSGRIAVAGSPESASWIEYGGDLAAGTFFRPNQDQFVVNEAHVTARLAPLTTVSLGRKKAMWSRMDEVWQLGMWQPRFAIDTLRPEEQGLTGLFFNTGTEDMEVMAFATPIFIPTMGPEISEENGSLVPDNRWYRRPSTTQIFNQQLNRVTYDLDVPNLEKLVMNPGYAAMTRFGNLRSGPWIVGSYAYKPVNDLLLRRQIVRVVDQPLFDVKVSPDVAYHELASVDVGYAWGDFQISASYLQDSPKEKRPQTEWSLQKLHALQAVSVQGEWNIRNFFARQVQIQFGHLRITGGGITDIDSEGKTDDFTLFDDRMRFRNATYVGAEGELARLWARPLATKVRYLYDQQQQGSMVRTEFLYYPRTDLALIVGTDFLGVADENHEPDGFLNQYRANDRYYGGMTYVF
ncbi:MAG: transposase [Bdellovibrionaceae bacterium]|nr:transposase [Pseudobdellovibrionaceae bacterium]